MFEALLQSVNPGVLAWCAGALLLGGFVKGVMGVGLPMISVPLMSFVLPPYIAAALVVIPVFPANALQLRAGGPLIQKFRRFWPVSLGIAIGTFAGGWFFINADPRWLRLVVGVIVAIYALQRVTSNRFSLSRKSEGPVGFVVGAVGGAIGGMAMLIGPIIVMYMGALRLERDVFVGSIAFIYLVTTTVIGVALASYSQLTAQLVVASVAACLPTVMGVALGSWCRERISQRLFDRLLTLLIAAIAISLITRALLGMD